MKQPRRWLVLGAGGRLGRVLCTPERPYLVGADRRAVDATVADGIFLALTAGDFYGVVNLAAAADVARCEREPEWAYAGNVLTARATALAACRAGKPFVHVSTDYVFGGGEPDEVQGRAPFWPHEPVAPVNVYGRSKAAGEGAASEVARGYAYARGAIARMSFLADPPGYAWVIGGVQVTKEWIEDAAVRLDRFLSAVWTFDIETVHLVPRHGMMLDALVRERYPNVPVVPYEEGLQRLPYRLPADLRLGGAWRG